MDWPGLMWLGLRELRLKPHEFWNLTPMELLVMLGRDKDQDTVLGRQRFLELLSLYPDKKE